MMQFNEGDRVYLREDSQYYNDGGGQLPPNVVGIIIKLIGDYYRVEWESKGKTRSNTYHDEDLKSALKIIHPTLKPNA